MIVTGLARTTGLSPKTQLTWRGLLALMAVFTALCTLFALVVTVAEGWRDHAQAQWPRATARIERCSVDPTSGRRRSRDYIDCRLSYVVGAEEIVTKIYSRSVPSTRTALWQYPPNQTGQLQQWVDKHPRGTPIAVHYDPENHKKAVLVETDMPMGGPHTPDNLKLLGIAAASSAVLLGIARITQPRTV